MPPRAPENPGAVTAARQWLRRRRGRIAAVLLVLLVVVRIALPSIVRSQIEKQANAALTGRLVVGDVDLWLLLGGVALEDVALHAENAAPTDPPLVAFKRLYVKVGYLPFLRHTVRIKDFALDAPAVALERLASGAVPLPGPRTPATAAAPAPEAKDAAAKPPAGTPWNIVVDKAVLRDGRFRLRDHVSEPPETVEVARDALGLERFTLRSTAEGQPGHGTIEAKFGDGTIRLDNTITTRDAGFAIETIVDIANLPLDRTQVHAPQLGWSALGGRLDAHVTLRAEPGALPVSSGTLALRDLRIDVPGEPEPALAWRKLAVELDELGIERRRAIVKSVVLDGGSVIVTPRSPAPLPLLVGFAPKADAAVPPAAPARPSKPWTWKVERVEIADTKATVALEPPPLVIEIVKGTITDLDSAPGSQARLDLQLREEQGTLGLTGTVGLDPLAADVNARIDGLGLGRLMAASGAVPARLPGGTLGAELGIRAEQGALAVAGKLTVADLAVRTPEGEDFALDWKRLDLGIRELRVPGVLPGAPAGTTDPIRVDLDQIHLVAPSLSLTRTPEGLVLPTGAPPPADASAAPAPAKAPAPPDAPPARPLSVVVARLDLENGQVSILDRTVKPFYRGKVSAIGLQARDLRVPENAFSTFTVTASLPGGAPLKVEGKQAKGTIQITVDGKGLPLRQFNPYVTQAAGYTIADGRLTVGATVRYGSAGYDSKTRLQFDQLGVAGAEGDSLFLQKVGIPLNLALSLLRDLHGRIALDVPVRGDKSGTHVALGSIVADALLKAIVGAVMSPLKMFGAVVDLAGGKGRAVAPEPVPCRAGAAAVDAGARARVEQIAGGLAGAPGLKITLHGSAGGPDVRALQESAVLADLEAKQGVLGGIKHLANRTERNAIRDALAARAGGDSADLSPDYQKTLDEWAGAKQVSDDQLRTLAVARADALRTALVQEHGIDAGRVGTGDPAVDRAQGVPAVTVGLGF